MASTLAAAVAQDVSLCGGRLADMGKQELVAEILSLPVEDRLDLAEAIWASISAAPDALPLTDWQKEELDRRQIIRLISEASLHSRLRRPQQRLPR